MIKKIKAFLYVLKNSALRPAYYREILKAPFSFSFKYFFVLFAFLGLSMAIFISFLAVQKGLPYFDQLKSTLPDLYPSELVVTIKDHQVSINVPEPYFIPLKADLFPKDLAEAINRQPIFNLMVIDTNASPTDIKKYQTFTLLTKDSIVYLANDDEIRMRTLEEATDFVLERKVIDEFWQQVVPVLEKIVPFAVIATLVFLPLGMVLFTLFSLIFISLATWILAQIFKHRSINYGKALQINLHAITLPTFIISLFQVLGAPPQIPFFRTIILLIFNLIIFASLKEKLALKK